MNNTQKGAYYILLMALFMLANIVYMGVSVAKTQKLPDNNWMLPLFCLLFIVVPFFVFRKDIFSGSVQKDERDIMIQRNAATTSFFVLSSLVFAAVLAAAGIEGRGGAVPVTWLWLGVLSVMFLSFTIYTVLVLVQYGKEGGSDE